MRRNALLRVRTTEAEYELLRTAAEQEGATISVIVRAAALVAARGLIATRENRQAKVLAAVQADVTP